jgi:hypothetical protein
MQWPLPLYLDWLSLDAQSACNWLMLHLEFGSGVGSNFGVKIELSEQNPELQAAKMVTHFDRKGCFSHVPPSFYFLFFSSNLFNII